MIPCRLSILHVAPTGEPVGATNAGNVQLPSEILCLRLVRTVPISVVLLLGAYRSSSQMLLAVK